MKKPAFLTKAWFSRHGITTRIVLLFLVLVIIPFFVMAAFVVGIFRDYNITTLGNSAMDSMASVGYQISGELKNRMESRHHRFLQYSRRGLRLLPQRRLPFHR